MSNIIQQNQSYRRGLILGLTIAESVVLIIFALLLILTTLLISKDSQLRTCQSEKQTLAERCHDADELLRSLREQNKKIAVLEKKLVDLEAELLARNQKIAILERKAADLEAQLTELEKVRQMVERINQQIPGDQVLSEKLDVLIKQAESWKRLVQQITKGQALPDEQIQGMLNKVLEKIGTERPSCWVATDGKPQYIFTIELRANGVIVHDNAIRPEEQQQLPLGSFVFEREMSYAQFRNAAEALRSWAKEERADKQSCVFFVRVIDRTPANQKALYKNRLRIVGEYFYYFEP